MLGGAVATIGALGPWSAPVAASAATTGGGSALLASGRGAWGTPLGTQQVATSINFTAGGVGTFAVGTNTSGVATVASCYGTGYGLESLASAVGTLSIVCATANSSLSVTGQYARFGHDLVATGNGSLQVAAGTATVHVTLHLHVTPTSVQAPSGFTATGSVAVVDNAP